MKAIKLLLDARTDVGCVRTNNEDNFIVCSDLDAQNWTINESEITLSTKGCLLVVADGMGGMNAGEVASAIAIDTVKNMFSSLSDEIIKSDSSIRNYLIKVVQTADKEIITYGKQHPETAGMGTTLVIAWLINDKAYVAWCGDSRAYYSVKNQKGIIQISKDHSYVQELVDAKKITDDEAFYHPNSNIITRSLGSADKRAIPDVVSIPLYDDMRILLCTDGLNGMIMDNQIGDILYEETNIRKCKDSLIAAAKAAGGHDNVTVILCDVVSGAGKYDRISNELNNDNTEEKTRSKSQRIWMMIIGILLVVGLIVLAFFAGLRYSHYQNDPSNYQTPIDSLTIDESINEETIEEGEDVITTPVPAEKVNERSIQNQRAILNNLPNTPSPDNADSSATIEPLEQESNSSITTIEEEKPTTQQEEAKKVKDENTNEKNEESNQMQDEVETSNSSSATEIPNNDQ